MLLSESPGESINTIKLLNPISQSTQEHPSSLFKTNRNQNQQTRTNPLLLQALCSSRDKRSLSSHDSEKQEELEVVLEWLGQRLDQESEAKGLILLTLLKS